MGLVMLVLMESLAVAWGPFNRLYGETTFKHGMVVGSGILTTVILLLNKRVKVWADEAVIEIKKVVWPSRRDTTAMTIVVVVMLLISGVVLGLFDFLSGNLVKMLVN